jgi:hypothetical protein
MTVLVNVCMVEFSSSLSSAEPTGLRLSQDDDEFVASLRHFDTEGEFLRTTSRIIGSQLPDACRIVSPVAQVNRGMTILAWRSPTETLLLCDDGSLIEQLEAATAMHVDGCVIDLTGGVQVLRAQGDSVSDLFGRAGGQATFPALGEARGSRFAGVPVLALQARRGEILLILDRVHVEHLMSWVCVVAEDLLAR